MAAWTSCHCWTGTGRDAEIVEDGMTVAEVDTLLGSATTAENEKIARSAVHVVDRERLKSVGSLRQFVEQSGIEWKDLTAKIHGTKVSARLEVRSHGNPGPIVLVQAWE